MSALAPLIEEYLAATQTLRQQQLANLRDQLQRKAG